MVVVGWWEFGYGVFGVWEWGGFCGGDVLGFVGIDRVSEDGLCVCYRLVGVCCWGGEDVCVYVWVVV